MLRFIRWTLRELSQGQLCAKVKALGVSLNMTEVSQIERKGMGITIEKAAAIAKALGVESDVLWEPFGDNPNLVRQRERNDELTMRAKASVKAGGV